MDKWYVTAGNYLFNYLVITVTIIVTSIFIIPIYPLYIGLIAFYKYDDQYKMIFTTIKENIVNILLLTLTILFLAGLIYLTFVIANTKFSNDFNIIIRYFIIGLLINFFIYPPIIMIQMDVSYKELLKNSLYLTLTQFPKTLFMFIITAVFVWLVTVEPLVLFLIVPYVQTMSYISNKSIEELKNRGENENEKNI